MKKFRMWKAPLFWWERKTSLLARSLLPLAWMYEGGRFLHSKLNVRHPVRAPFPVISIGGLVMGGSGKTPTTLALARLLQKRGWKPIVLTRGFGGSLKGPLWVESEKYDYTHVGDEALLLAQWFPTVMSKRRADALSLLPQEERTILLLDDGHQHSSLVKDLSFLVIDAHQGYGNGCIFPAGPLREAIQKGMARADGIIWIGEKGPPAFSKPLFRGRIQARCTLREGARVIGFAGLGYPQKFEKTLHDLRLDVSQFIAFPDHFPYHPNKLEELEQRAHHCQATLVTTEKDFYRLPLSFREKVRRVKMEIVWDAPEDLETFLRERL